MTEMTNDSNSAELSFAKKKRTKYEKIKKKKNFFSLPGVFSGFFEHDLFMPKVMS